MFAKIHVHMRHEYFELLKIASGAVELFRLKQQLLKIFTKAKPAPPISQ